MSSRTVRRPLTMFTLVGALGTPIVLAALARVAQVCGGSQAAPGAGRRVEGARGRERAFQSERHSGEYLDWDFANSKLFNGLHEQSRRTHDVADGQRLPAGGRFGPNICPQ